MRLQEEARAGLDLTGATCFSQLFGPLDLRIALLSALADPHGATATSPGERPAFRRFAGKSVLAHQVDCAAHLGCTRILCLAAGMGPDLGAAKSYAERAGLRVDIVDTLPRLASQVSADDEVVAIADGVLPDRTALVDAIAQRAGVLAFPEDPALALGFERLDATRAWSGVLKTRGDAVARLADMPSDSDMASTLLRIALQMGVGVVELDIAPLKERTWQRRADRQAGPDIEWRWITRQVSPAPFVAPGMALAERIGLRWAHDAGGGRWARAPHVVTAIAGAVAILALLAGWPLAALLSLLATSISIAIARIFDRVEALGARPRDRGSLMTVAGLLRDGLVIVALAQLVFVVPGWLAWLLPIVMLAVLHLGEITAPVRFRSLFGDRILLLIVLVAAAYWSWATVAILTAIALGLGALLWASKATARITAD